MTSNHAEGLSLVAVKERVAEIWAEILKMPEGQEKATFFELQGQSISAVRIAARIEDELGVPVDIGDLFEDPDLNTFVSGVLAKFDGVKSGSA